MKNNYFSPDVSEFLYLLSKYKVKYLIVGGEAVIYYGHTRLTGDIDIYYSTVKENIKNLYLALKEFGYKIESIDNKPFEQSSEFICE